MFARVSTYSSDDPDRLIEGFRTVSDQLEEIDGFSNAYFLLDRGHRRAISVTFWESEQALNASQQRADELRQQGTSAGGGTIDSVAHYEVAMTVGRGQR